MPRFMTPVIDNMTLKPSKTNKTAVKIPQKPKQLSKQKSGLHCRNYHIARYDFPQLMSVEPSLAEYVKTNDYGDDSIDFSNPEAVKTLNKALLNHFYHIKFWTIPKGYLCPPIPGRADYIHHLADLLAKSNDGLIPTGSNIRGLDIGVGANCVYPIIGNRVYGWQFVGSDIDLTSIKSAKFIVESNANLKGKISLRYQQHSYNIFAGIIAPNERFDFTLCNPPFHCSKQQAEQGSLRKLTHLAANSAKKSFRKVSVNNLQTQGTNKLNFGGQSNELWCAGGELAFIENMIQQSVNVANQCLWFTSLVSKKDNLAVIYKKLKSVNAKQVLTVNMAQGQKKSRFVAWSFLTPKQHLTWKADYWC